MKKLKSITLAIIITISFISILSYPKASATGVTQGLLFSANILIPSLFPFMFLSSFTVRSGLSSKLNDPLNKITNALFNLPGSTAATILISFIGGYPAGARGIRSLYEQNEINEKQAVQMLCFTVGGGPAFIVSVVGGKFLGNTNTGIILFASHVMSSILMGICIGRYSKVKQVSIHRSTVHKQKPSDISTALVKSCNDTTYAMINMCAFVVLFSALLSIVNTSSLQNIITQLFYFAKVPMDIASSIIPIAIEVTSGCSFSADHSVPIEVLAFALGWAGLCIHFQIFSTLDIIRFSKIKFIFFRLIHGILSALLAHVGLMCFSDILPTCSTSYHTTHMALFSSNAISSIALLILSVSFLFSTQKKTHSLYT